MQCAGEGWIVPPHEPFHTFETCPLIAQREKRLIQMRIGSKSNFVALKGILDRQVEGALFKTGS